MTVDFNARGRDGLVKASRRRADGPLGVGDKVVAVDPDEGMEFDAEVDSIDDTTGRVYLRVHWQASGEPFLSDLRVLGGYVTIISEPSTEIMKVSQPLVKSWRPGQDIEAALAVTGAASADQ